jgi:hypothetical protein
MRFERPKPGEEFTTAQLDDNAVQTVKIGANLPPQVQESLIRCLKANADVRHHHHTIRNVGNTSIGFMTPP